MPLNILEVVLLLRGVSEYVAGSEKATMATKELGTATEQTGLKAKGGWKGMLKFAAGAEAIYAGAKFIQGAVDQTNQLAKATNALKIQTGMDAATSSEWIGLTKERGVATKTFQMGLVKLSKTMETARLGTSKESTVVQGLRKQIDQVAAAGGKDAPKQLAKLSSAIASAQKGGVTARKVMAQLGIPLKDIAHATTGQLLMKVADAMHNMTDKTTRAALAQQVFGRAGVQLLPVLSQGAAGVRKLLDEQKKAGNYLTEKQLKAEKQNIANQRALEQAVQGLKTQLALALLPAITGVTKVLVALAKILRPVTSNAKVMRLILIGLVAGLVAWKLAVMLLTVQQKIATATTEGWTAAQWLLNVALDANVIALVVIAIIALVAIFVIAYKHVGWFRDIVNETWKVLLQGAQLVWGWFKKYWPYLLGILAGPFGLAAVLIIKHFGQIKSFVLGIVDDIKKAFNGLIAFVKNIPHRIGSAIRKVPLVGKALGAASSVAGFAAHPHLQSGGNVIRGGGFMVGEHGPEIVGLPAGSMVSPLLGSQGTFGGRGDSGQPLEIHVPVYLDGRQVARSVAKVTADRLARR